ncbi:MAG: hypothetical protein ACK5Z2_15860 [Bacteroidota bacterium]|jgi:hypothetical protein
MNQCRSTDFIKAYRVLLIFLVVFLFSLFIISCNNKSKSYSPSEIYQDSPPLIIADTPHVKVHVTIPCSVFKAGDDIPITVSLRSTAKVAQRILFERKGFPYYGLWRTYMRIDDLKTGISVLKYNSFELLHSQLFSESDVNYIIGPDKTLSRSCKISNLAAIENEKENRLKPGKYKVSLIYSNLESNEIIIEVKP